MAEIKAPKLVASGQSTATTYHFRRDDRDFGWALCTVNDQTGELLITSDWGNWAHRWPADPRSLGHPTLTHFIAARDAWGEHACDYLANKLTTREQRQRFDLRKTIAALRKLLCERRLEENRSGRDSLLLNRVGELNRHAARDLWNEIGDIDATDATLFCERFMQLDDYQLITAAPWENLEYVPTTEYIVLRDGILPALVEACAAEVKRRADAQAVRELLAPSEVPWP